MAPWAGPGAGLPSVWAPLRGLGDGGTQGAMKGVNALGVWGWVSRRSRGWAGGRCCEAPGSWRGKGSGSLRTPWGGCVGTPLWGPQCHRTGGKAAVELWGCLQGVPPCWDKGCPRGPLPSTSQAVAAAMLLDGCVSSHSPRNPAAVAAVLSEGDPNPYRQGGGWCGWVPVTTGATSSLCSATRPAKLTGGPRRNRCN